MAGSPRDLCGLPTKNGLFQKKSLQLYGNKGRSHSAKGSGLQDNLICLFKI